MINDGDDVEKVLKLLQESEPLKPQTLKDIAKKVDTQLDTNIDKLMATRPDQALNEKELGAIMKLNEMVGTTIVERTKENSAASHRGTGATHSGGTRALPVGCKHFTRRESGVRIRVFLQ